MAPENPIKLLTYPKLAKKMQENKAAAKPLRNILHIQSAHQRAKSWDARRRNDCDTFGI
jgi:hypothetical protein